MINNRFFPYIVISVLFLGGLFGLYREQEKKLFTQYEDRICLNENTERDVFEKVLLDNNYVSTEKDARLISEWLIDSLFKHKGQHLDNIGALNRRDFQIPASLIENKGGSGLIKRLELSYHDLGCDVPDSIYQQCSSRSIEIPDSLSKTIVVSVNNSKRTTWGEEGIADVPVRLIQYNKGIDPLNHKEYAIEDTVAFKLTDSNGKVTFKVARDGYYSILPIKHGYEYGVPLGTTHGKPIGEDYETFKFRQKNHLLRMFDRETYSRIKADHIFSVRTIGDYLNELVKTSVIFLLAWFAVFFTLYIRDKQFIKADCSKYRKSDNCIAWLLMLLNATCIIIMLSIVNPLIDKDYANEMTIGTLVGCILICILSCFDYVKYYSDQYFVKFDSISKLLQRNISRNVPDGFGFILSSIVLVCILWLFGTGPEGSTAKVNLNLGIISFQPSEISKFLFVAAIALFFTANSSKIQSYSNRRNFKSQFNTILVISLSALILLGLYILAVSDMGPALVLAITFIIMYSIVRQDVGQMIIGVLSYVCVLSFSSYLSNLAVEDDVVFSGLSITLWLSLLWAVIWFGGSYLWKKQVYESAGIMNLLLLLFTRGGEMLYNCGFQNQGRRLMDRIAASGDGIWNNTVNGGDQVAQGIWGLSAGGFFGQGIGEGNSNLIPAFHTDMIFESIGEVMGFLALVVLLICYALLIIRCLYKAKETGHPFLFYMISGVGIVTSVQACVIIMGSLGIVPLTGVSLPFLSYGKVGLIINLAVFGIVLGMTRNNATIAQKKSIVGYNTVIKNCSIIFALLYSIVFGYAFNYQVLSRYIYMTKTAHITNIAGEHYPEQNPRIGLLLRNLQAGNIYDRNGLLLATSSSDVLLQYRDSLLLAGLNKSRIDSLSHMKKKRYYPFEEHLFFMLGDINTRNLSHGVFGKNPYGYLAEERHADALRGFAIDRKEDRITRVKKISPFMSDSVYQTTWMAPAYEGNDMIVKMLKDGVNGNLVKEWNASRQSRDLRMTIDARLQTVMEKRLAEGAKKLKDQFSRVSLVILDAEHGDLLCAANYPTPNQQQIVDLFNKNIYSYKQDPVIGRYTERDLALTYQTAPGSTAKIISSAAGLNKDRDVYKQRIQIYNEERIDTAGARPEPFGRVDMEMAIVQSSNCYYVNLVHKDRLYGELCDLYEKLGVGVETKIPYVFTLSEQTSHDESEYRSCINELATIGYNKYDEYVAQRGKNQYGYKKMNFPECAMAWGQGLMIASPLNMARMASAVVNNGILMNTRYLIGQEESSVVCINDQDASKKLKEFMQAESASHPATKKFADILMMGGKTGTPTRTISRRNKNDGWYICFFNSKIGKTALAIRIEQCGSSAVATSWMNEIIMPVLKDVEYVNY